MLLKFIHIINLFSILLSTSGLMMYQHYCQDELKSLSVFSNLTKPCCNEQTILDYEKCSGQTSFNKKPCCQDKTLFQVNDTAQQIDDVSSVENVELISIQFPKKLASAPIQTTINAEVVNLFPHFSAKAPPRSLFLFFCSFLC